MRTKVFVYETFNQKIVLQNFDNLDSKQNWIN